MTKSDGVDKVISDLSARAHKIVDDGHSESEILKSAMMDFKSLNSLGGMLSFMTTGKLNPKQEEIAQRIAVKVIAILGMREAQ